MNNGQQFPYKLNVLEIKELPSSKITDPLADLTKGI